MYNTANNAISGDLATANTDLNAAENNFIKWAKDYNPPNWVNWALGLSAVAVAGFVGYLVYKDTYPPSNYRKLKKSERRWIKTQQAYDRAKKRAKHK
jgi:hypothetical protein